MKRIYRRIRIEVLAFIGSIVLRLLGSTIRWSKNDGTTERIWEDGKPRVFAFWHGRQLFMPSLHKLATAKFKRKGLYTLISEHSDGRIIARLIRYMGLGSVAGSSTRGGVKAMLGLIRKYEEGYDIGITPDGPKGPIYKMKKGALHLAQETGAKLYPATASAEKYWKFKSWDQMMLPKPFTKAVCLVGEPIVVPKTASDEEIKNLEIIFEERMNALVKEADEYLYS